MIKKSNAWLISAMLFIGGGLIGIVAVLGLKVFIFCSMLELGMFCYCRATRHRIMEDDGYVKQTKR